MRHGDSAASTLKGAAAMVDFGAAWGLLVGLSAKAAAFLEVIFLSVGCAWRLADVDLGELDLDTGRDDWDFVDESVKAVMVSGGCKVVIPDAVGCGWLGHPVVVAGKLLGVVVEGGWWRVRDPSVVAGELLDFVVESEWRRLGGSTNPSMASCEVLGGLVEHGRSGLWDRTPAIVAGELLERVVETDVGEDRETWWFTGMDDRVDRVGVVGGGDSWGGGGLLGSGRWW